MNIAVTLAESMKSRGAQLAYGDPVVAEGMTVIPVAYVVYGFGGGGADDTNGGGGGGGTSIPLGIYKLANGEVRFIPNLVVVVAVGAPLVIAIGRALSKLIKALR